MKNYILVTPVRNEEKNLTNLIRCIKNQTITPTIWVIVDDGSTDKTPLILNKLKKKYNWVHIITLKMSNEYMGMHYSFVCNNGFDYSIKYCNKNKLKYEYIGLVDADIIIERDYFEKLIQNLVKDPKLGIVSGEIYYKTKNKIIGSNASENLPTGAARLWRKKCFFETGGYQITRAPDSVSNIKAKLAGWKIIRYLKIKVIQTRKTGSGIGIWTGYKGRGEIAYYFNTHPILVLLKFIKYSITKPYYIGIAFLIGYFKSFVIKLPKIIDKEIRNYYRNIQLKLAVQEFLIK